MRAPRLLGLLVGSIALAAALFLFVLPSRTYLAQRRSLSAAATRLRVFHDENARLAASVERLKSDAEVERLAREKYGLVKPGEKAYLMVPSPSPPGAAGATGHRAPDHRAPATATTKPATPGLLSRMWRDLQFWN